MYWFYKAKQCIECKRKQANNTKIKREEEGEKK
jgi:hypothetical protein